MIITNAQIEEAKRKISEEFMDHFYTFIEDAKAFGTTYDFGRKYGIYFRNEEMVAKRTKANLTNIVWFQSNIFSMRRYTADWEKAGYDKNVIWKLVDLGFLSETIGYNSNYHKTFYFIPQKTAKEIFKQYKR